MRTHCHFAIYSENAMEDQTDSLLTRRRLAERWDSSIRTVDRIRVDGRLPWVDLAGGKGARSIIRFRLRDVKAYEAANRKEIMSNAG